MRLDVNVNVNVNGKGKQYVSRHLKTVYSQLDKPLEVYITPKDNSLKKSLIRAILTEIHKNPHSVKKSGNSRDEYKPPQALS
jgi:hypothetical protein